MWSAWTIGCTYPKICVALIGNTTCFHATADSNVRPWKKLFRHNWMGDSCFPELNCSQMIADTIFCTAATATQNPKAARSSDQALSLLLSSTMSNKVNPTWLVTEAYATLLSGDHTWRSSDIPQPASVTSLTWSAESTSTLAELLDTSQVVRLFQQH